MRKALYTFYTMLASYPVILLLLLSSAGVIYLGTGYRPIEARYELLLEERMEVKRERQRLAKELEGMRQGDLRKRLQIFSNEFINEQQMEDKRLLNIVDMAFQASGWKLDKANVMQFNETNNELGLGLLAVAYTGQTQRTLMGDGSEFLPAHTLLQACNYLWRKAPIKDFCRIRIERNATGFQTDLEVVYPLAETEIEEVSE